MTFGTSLYLLFALAVGPLFQGRRRFPAASRASFRAPTAPASTIESISFRIRSTTCAPGTSRGQTEPSMTSARGRCRQMEGLSN